ncbi:MAG: DNA mismatch repair protein MutS [Flavobacteriaceae bacterium]|nr:DNA mismatch repair protein MutS [Flavobacteriaceae bacterium]
MATKAKKKKATPLMQQYNTIKSKHPDAMLLFRVGDFYETFGGDAIKASKILGIVLTHRNNGSSKTELAGFPHHSLNTYLPKLVKAGERVAICDQLEDPKQTKTIVKRGVTELVTPGVALNDDILDSKTNNFLAAVYFQKNQIGISFLDISTGEFFATQGNRDYIDKLLQNFSPSEIIVSRPQKTQFIETFHTSISVFYQEDWVFQEDFALESLTKTFRTNSLKGFGISDMPLGIIAASACLHYLSETQHHQLPHIRHIQRIEKDAYVWLDRFTIRNLELFQPTNIGGVALIDIIDKTITPMGGRLLKRWLALPLKDIEALQDRQDIVARLHHQGALRVEIQQQLQQIGDIERLISKVATERINPKELLHLKNSLRAIVPIGELMTKSGDSILVSFAKELEDCEDLCITIENSLHPEAPALLSKGNVIAKGYNDKLDEYRELAYSGKDYLNNMLEREMERTGISSLKIASNNVFGYYIEVRNTHKDKVPEEWIRKQTLVNAERYITEELKTYESKILGAEEQIAILEQGLFSEIVKQIAADIQKIQRNGQLVAKIDVLTSFAQLAVDNHYNIPQLHENTQLQIVAGRHPVIEKQLPLDQPFIANDIALDPKNQQIIMITGPNMSGKSAILRQTALIVLMAQIGSFVPAKEAHIGIVDKIFTRVGASDNISMGESTFMVEMNETASILNNISDGSLVLLDEIGRGTSTYDGISIAWAISEYLHQHPSKPKTLFATHYHELNEMTNLFERIKNYNVAVKETATNVLFLRKLVPGGSQHSFGIHVAKMAGMPVEVIRKANQVLLQLEQSHRSEAVSDSLQTIENDMQLSFIQLDDPLLDAVKEEILSTDIDRLTPVEALMKLHHIQKLLKPQKV